jgi:uncharacterized Ntn-hydrolase superfamily protein
MLGAMRWVRSTLVWLGLAAVSIVGSAPPASATIVIVAVAPGSGEVGAVGSSCAPVDLAGAAVLVPGVGAATVLGPREERTAGKLLRKLDEEGAVAVLRRVEGLNPDGAHRYAVAVLPPSTAIGGTGAAPPIARAGRVATAAGQGDRLRNPDQVDRALEAFDASRGALPDRLLAALDAGNRGGGDRRCGRQRATSAFLIVTDPLGSVVIPARGLEDVRRKQQQILNTLGGQIASDEVADRLLEAAALPRPVGPGAPSVYLSLLQPRGGFDAVTLLRQAFEGSQASATPTPTATAVHTQDPARSDGGPDGVMAMLVLGAAVVVVLALTRRRRRREGGPDDNG